MLITSAIATMTKQETFAKVVTHLREQAERAVGEDGRCKYRAASGFKCAAGCLIADEHYNRRFEGAAADAHDVKAALQASGVPEEANNLVFDLQRVHDHDPPHRWEEAFANVARVYQLEVPPL